MSATAPRSFVYSPLDTSISEIRLIRLHSQDCANLDLVTCSIEHASLEDPGCIYEALSYEWGADTKTPCQIVLNEVCLPVRENLFKALWHLRGGGDGAGLRVLWIDALCINQSDDIEKEFQVKQMGRIYARAWRVVVWVGDNIQHISESRRVPSLTWDQKDSAACLASNMSDLINILSNPEKLTFENPADYKKWGSILAFCDRTYWSRLWIIQEVVLAPRLVVQGGAYTFDFVLLETAFEKHMKIHRLEFTDEMKSSLNLIAKTTLHEIYAQRTKRQSRCDSLLGIVHLYREALCVDPRDRIFGVLELAPACCKAKVDISYLKSEWGNLESAFQHHYKEHKSAELSDYQIRSLVYYFAQRGSSPRSWNSTLPSEIWFSEGEATVASVRCALLGVVLACEMAPKNEMLVGHYTSEETNILYSKNPGAPNDPNVLPKARDLDSENPDRYYQGTSIWPDASQLRSPALRDGYESFRRVWDDGVKAYGWSNCTGAIIAGSQQTKKIDLVAEEMSSIRSCGDAQPGDLIVGPMNGNGAMALRLQDDRLKVVMFMMKPPRFPNERWRWVRPLYMGFGLLRAWHEWMMFGLGSEFEIGQIDREQVTYEMGIPSSRHS